MAEKYQGSNYFAELAKESVKRLAARQQRERRPDAALTPEGFDLYPRAAYSIDQLRHQMKHGIEEPIFPEFQDLEE